jgi:hypothetical protein
MKNYKLSISGFAKKGRLEILSGGQFVFDEEIIVASESIPWGNKVVTGINRLSLTKTILSFDFRLSPGRVSDKIWVHFSISSDKPYAFFSCDFGLTHQFILKSAADQRDITIETKSIGIFLDASSKLEAFHANLSAEELKLLTSQCSSPETSLESTLQGEQDAVTNHRG